MIVKPTVFVVDDEEGVRLSVCALAESMGFATRGYAGGAAYLQDYHERMAGCVVTDMRMPGMTGLDLQRQLSERGSILPVIVLTGFADTKLVVEALRQGAVMLLEKPCTNGELSAAIGEAVARDSARRTVAARLSRLTEDEREVLRLLVEGRSNKAIAKELRMGLRTVEARRHNIFEKSGTSTVAELVKLFIQATAAAG